ncbi:MAG: paraquat-inducible protein A [Oleiphilaceae bacterium]
MLYKHIGFALSIVAIGLFVPGILAPIFTLNMELALVLAGPTISSELVNKELSIIGTVQELIHEGKLLVALLIFSFSVVIPLIKAGLLTVVYFTKNIELQHKISTFVAVISKWSMADVFVVAIFLAVLSTDHSQSVKQHQLSFFGMSLDFEISTQTLSNVGMGFYFFVGYCIVSLIGSQLLLSAVNRSQNMMMNKNVQETASKTQEKVVKIPESGVD